MKTVNQVSKLTGISIRTLHYYDEIGLLKPAFISESGYRMYDSRNLERLQEILLLKELDFPLKDIQAVLDSDMYDRKEALSQQIELLEMKRERLDRLISLAIQIREGTDNMSFQEFNNQKMEEYTAAAKKKWGHTEAYKEYESKTSGCTADQKQKTAESLMDIFTEFGKVKMVSPEEAPAQDLVKKLQEFITKHYYTCTQEILSGLGKMYSAGGEMTENIDKAGGKGTAEFASKAIAFYCR